MYKNNKRKGKLKKIILTIVITIFFIIIITLYSVYSTIDINTYEGDSKQNIIRLSRNCGTRERK